MKMFLYMVMLKKNLEDGNNSPSPSLATAKEESRG